MRRRLVHRNKQRFFTDSDSFCN